MIVTLGSAGVGQHRNTATPQRRPGSGPDVRRGRRVHGRHRDPAKLRRRRGPERSRLRCLVSDGGIVVATDLAQQGLYLVREPWTSACSTAEHRSGDGGNHQLLAATHIASDARLTAATDLRRVRPRQLVEPVDLPGLLRDRGRVGPSGGGRRRRRARFEHLRQWPGGLAAGAGAGDAGDVAGGAAAGSVAVSAAIWPWRA